MGWEKTSIVVFYLLKSHVRLLTEWSIDISVQVKCQMALNLNLRLYYSVNKWNKSKPIPMIKICSFLHRQGLKNRFDDSIAISCDIWDSQAKKVGLQIEIQLPSPELLQRIFEIVQPLYNCKQSLNRNFCRLNFYCDVRKNKI